MDESEPQPPPLTEQRPLTRIERRQQEQREYWLWLARTALTLTGVGAAVFLAFVAVGTAAGLIDPLAGLGGGEQPAAPAPAAAPQSASPDPSYLPGISTTVSPSPYQEHPNPPESSAPAPGSGSAAALVNLPNLPNPTAEKPLVVWYGGDSLSGMPGESFARQSEPSGVIETVVDCQGGSRLASSVPVDWTSEMESELAEHKPGAVVFTIGTNDGGAQVDASGTIVQFGTRAWAIEYRRRVSAMIDLMVRNGVRRVYWLGAPVMADESFSDRLAWLNKVVEPEVFSHRRAVYIDAWKILSDEKRRYVTEWRTFDGVHLSTSGADRLAAAVLRIVRREWLR